MEEESIDDGATEQQESIAALCARLAEDAKILARAEIARVRAVIFRRIVKGRLAILAMVGSALLAQSAALLLLVGLLMFLRHHVGVLWATAIVFTLAVALSAALAWIAYRQVRRALSKEDDLL